MSQPDEVRIHHMVDAAEKAVAFANGRTREEPDTDEMIRFALIKLVEIVGEAGKQVTPETGGSIPRSRGRRLPGGRPARSPLLRCQPRRLVVNRDGRSTRANSTPPRTP
jgi:hypothetical protein